MSFASKGCRSGSRLVGGTVVASLLFACAPGGGSGGLPVPAAQAAVATSGPLPLPRHDDVVTAMKRAADYYRGSYAVTTQRRNGWSWATYIDGLHQLYRTAGDEKYRTDAINWAKETSGALSADTNPDSIKAGQTYYDLAKLDPSISLAAMDAQMAKDLVRSPDGFYWWSDALFMGLPVWTRWAERTGDSRYLDAMDAVYAWTRDYGRSGVPRHFTCTGTANGLYDKTHKLWYRDCRYIGAVDDSGGKVFWARGNAWVVAAMAETLSTLPAGEARAAKYRTLLQEMAPRVREAQGSDGLWRSSLLNASLFPQPETSSTALFAYGLSYGIRAGLLDRATYLPVVAKAWAGLTSTSLKPSGFLTGCQTVGFEPAPSYPGSAPQTAPTATSPGTLHEDSPPFCVGAFLLAGSELSALTPAMSKGKAATATAQQAGAPASRAVDGDVTTRWTTSGFPKSLTVDLGAVYRASNSVVMPYGDRPYRYRVEVCVDGAAWTTVVDRTTNSTRGTLADAFSGGTVPLRYARLTVTGLASGATTSVSIREFAVHDRYNPRPDLTRGKPTTATSSRSANPPARATDGSSTTYWASGAAPTAAAPQVLTVDLRSAVRVDTARVFSRAGYGPRQVSILGSTNGTTFTALATGALPNSEGPHQFVFPAASVRYLRLSSTGSFNAASVQVKQWETFVAD